MMSSCWQVTFFPQTPASAEFENFLENYFEVTAQNYADDGRDEYVGYQSGTFDEDKMRAAASSAGISLPEYKIEHLESANWLKDYVIRFEPFETEDFIIYGIHEKEAPSSSKIPLQIYAATAFGSNHQTTRACLGAISDLHRRGFMPQKILDVGTGSGILSLASAKLWPQSRVIAVDIDEEAVLVTRSNALTNNVQQLNAEQSDGYNAPIVKNNAPYDLILANILARPLLAMSPDLSASLVSGGYAVLSGFVDEQSDWVVSAHQNLGLCLEKLYAIDNWRAALMKKV